MDLSQLDQMPPNLDFISPGHRVRVQGPRSPSWARLGTFLAEFHTMSDLVLSTQRARTDEECQLLRERLESRPITAVCEDSAAIVDG